MNNEENRLKTFGNWPSNAPVSPGRVAKAGFYYTGVGLEVQCFLCGTRITEWNYGDQVIVRHRHAAPDCPFVLDPSTTCNVPFVPPSNDNRELTLLNARSSHCKTNQLIPSREEEVNRNYRTINQRLSTFANWPIPDIVSPQKLAEAGFFYLQQKDMVVCVFCRGIIYQWEPGNDPDKEHRIHFPTCDFYLRPDSDIVQLTNVNLIGSTSDFQDLGIQTHSPPQSQNQSSYEARLRTYAHWPTGHSQIPEVLAEAGFFYIGYNDHVRCYHCDGGLHHWENTDDPWVEHAKWFPKCGFVNLVKGPKFISECVAKRPPADRVIEGDNNHDTNFGQSAYNSSGINENITENNTVTITEETEDNTVTITEETEEIEVNFETESPSVTETTSATEISSVTEVTSATEALSVTEATSATEALSVTETTSATEISSVTEATSATEALSVTEATSATEALSVTEATSATEALSVTEATSATEIPSVAEKYSQTEQNNQNINHDFFEGLVNRTIPGQTAIEIGLPREAIRIAMENRIERTGNSFSRTTELMQGVIECIEEDPNRAKRLNLSKADVMQRFLNIQIKQSTMNKTSKNSNNDIENSNTSTINRESETEEGPDSSQATKISDNNDKLEEKKTNTDPKTSSLSLEEENRKLKEARICKVCMDHEIAVVFLPCGHLATCARCAPSLTCCPICRKEIRATVRTFLS